jgi:branched-chain amino acid transport system ATP-binding protein
VPDRDLADGSCTEPQDLLTVTGLTTSYGAVEALRDVSFAVPEGEVVAILGANGAGKSTLLHTISGLLRAKAGSVVYEGVDITHLPAAKIVARGLCQVPEGRQLFGDLSGQDNLVVGRSGRSDWRGSLNDDIARVYELFPVLGERRKQPAGTLSGGEQQMLAIGRALIGKPRLLLRDEPSRVSLRSWWSNLRSAGEAQSRRSYHAHGGAERGDGSLMAHRGVVLQTGQ